MKRFLTAFACLTLTFSLALAQPNGKSKVTTGAVAFNNGDFEQAVVKTEEGMTLGGLDEKTLMKAHAVLAQAYLRVGETMGEKYPDAFEKSYQNFSKHRELDVAKKYNKTEMALVEAQLYSYLYNTGGLAYNDKNYERAYKYFEMANNMNKDFQSANMMAYAKLMVQDTATAMKFWGTTIEQYTAARAKNKEMEIDSSMQYAYYWLGTMQSKYAKDPRKGLEVLNAGRQEFPFSEDLKLAELAIYQQNKDLFKESQSKFEKAIADDPKNKTLKMAYAGMLTENGEEEKGLALYREILQNDPNDKEANFYLGVFYVNSAEKLNTRRKDPKITDKEDAELETQVVENLRQAYPYIQKVHEAEPDKLEWISQLVIISTYVPELAGDSKKWIEKRKQLGGN